MIVTTLTLTLITLTLTVMTLTLTLIQATFGGFEDFHQISTAISGLAGMSSEHSEVR
jgi:hypothetical protein